MIFRYRLVAGALLLVAIACGDPDVQLREEYRLGSLALEDEHVEGSKNVVQARDGWILHKGEIRYLNAGSFTGENAPNANDYPATEYADPVPAIVDFHRQLEERGIDLFFVPVPVRPVIYPEAVLGPEPFAGREDVPNLHPHLQELLAALREQGVRVIDLTPRFLKRREDPKRGSVFYPSETHWTPYGITLAATRMAAEIKKRPWYDAVEKFEFSQHWYTKVRSGGLFRDLKRETGIDLEPESVQMRRIKLKTENGKKKIGIDYPQSPVIVIGDSNTIFWRNFDSGLPQILAFEIGFPVDVFSSIGGGANATRINLVRRIQSEPEYLDGKKAVIWCFTARAFTNARQGWIPMPFE